MTSAEPAAPGVTVVIPALNEEQGIVSTLAAVREALATLSCDHEVIVVNDGSDDATAARAAESGARVIDHPAPGGYGRSLKTGIAAAKHETIVICDADGTYPAGEIPALVDAMSRFDMVVGQRTGPNYWRTMLRSPLRTTFLLLTSFVTGTWIPDPNSGLRAFRRAEVLPLLPRLPRAFSFTTTMTLIYTLRGRFVRYHPIAYLPRVGRSKVRVVRDALRVAQTMVEVVLEYNPLKMFLVMVAPLALATLIAVAWRAATGSGGVIAAMLGCTTALVSAMGLHAVIAAGPDRRVR